MPPKKLNEFNHFWWWLREACPETGGNPPFIEPICPAHLGIILPRYAFSDCTDCQSVITNSL